MSFSTPAAIFVSSFVIALSGALMPGPLLAVTVRAAARRGASSSFFLVLGHAILEAGLLGLLLMGLAEWVKGEAVATVVALAGGGVLLWMAAGMLREVRTLRFAGAEGEPAPGPGGSGPGALRSLLAGITVSLANPYWSMWWASIGLTYLVLSRGIGPAGVVFFFAGHILADAAWYLFVGFAVASGKKALSDRFYRGLVATCAVFMLFFGLWFGGLGVTKLFRIA